MKNLKDVLEKLKVDNIVLDREFPTGENLEDVIEFLKTEGFKEYQIDKNGVIGTLNKNKGKIFLLKENNRLLWFADTSKEEISKENPVFFLIKYKDGYKIEWRCFEENYETISTDKSKVFNLLNKRFGWK